MPEEAEVAMAKIALDYEGLVYVRPVGRGVSLEKGAPVEYLEDLDDGYYRVTLKFERLPWGSAEEAEAKAVMHPELAKPPEATP